jgi:hypothetical protein
VINTSTREKGRASAKRQRTHRDTDTKPPGKVEEVASARVPRRTCGSKRLGDDQEDEEANLFGYFKTMRTCRAKLRYFDWDGQVHLVKGKTGGQEQPKKKNYCPPKFAVRLLQVYIILHNACYTHTPWHTHTHTHTHKHDTLNRHVYITYIIIVMVRPGPRHTSAG